MASQHRPEVSSQVVVMSYKAEYERALADGKMDVAYSRVMLLGTAGVGKTCFKRSLMQQRWDPSSINSTIVSDIESVRPVGREWQGLGREGNEQWTAVTEEDELEEMAELMAAVHRHDFSDVRSKVSADKLFQAPSNIGTSEISQASVEKIEKTHVQLILSRAIDHAAVLRRRRSQIKSQPFVHFWDCGGQPVFLEVLPAFLTSRTMFMLLYDASKSFHEKWKSVQTVQGQMKDEEEVNITTLELLHNWMSNIHVHLAKKDDKGALLDYPRILCIGSRGDKLSKSRRKAVISELQSHCERKPFEALIDGYYIIDNTTAGKGKNEDPSFATIRDKIRNFTSHKLIIETPISWVLFRKVIQMFETNVISVKEAQAIGVACKIPPEVVPQVLLYYHDLGVVLFYPHINGLQDTVIISPQWFVKALGKVLTLQGREEYKVGLMWKLLREKGILVQSLYAAAWGEVEGIDPEAMINLLVHFRLAAEVKTDEYHDIEDKQYFLPLVLPSFDDKKATVPPGCLQRATPLHITFRTGFVPPGFFTRFITSMASSPLCKILFQEGVYRNRVSIKFGSPPSDDVIFMELPHVIQVDVLRYSPENDALLKFTHVCQELRDFLQKIAKEVDQCLFDSSTIGNTKLFKEVRFLCAVGKCNATSGPHYLQHVEGQTCDRHLECEKSRQHRLMSEKEGLWFPDTKSAKKVTIQLDDKEMLSISERIPHDQLPRLAAHFNMIATFRKIQADPSKSTTTGFSFLYEWAQAKAGVRQELVEALKEINLLQLALMVEQAEYDPAKLKMPDTQDRKDSVQSTIELPSHVPAASVDSGAAATATTQPAAAQPKLLIANNDLLRCSGYFKESDIRKLIGLLDGDTGLNLQAVSQQHETNQLKAYWILKKWLIANPDTTRDDLKETLELLGFSKAAKNLLPPEKQESSCKIM